MESPSHSSIILHEGDRPRPLFYQISNFFKDTTVPVPVDYDGGTGISLKKPKGWGQRHTIAFLGLWAFAMSYAMRFNLTIAIVAMAKSPPSPHQAFFLDGNTTDSFECEGDVGPVADEAVGDGEFDWDAEDQGNILASFFWGYVLTQLPGGFLSNRFGGKWPFGVGLLISGIFTLLTPLAARVNIAMLMFVRIIQGLGQGMMYPAMQTILSSWSPPEERSQLSSIAFSGAQFGAAATMIVSGYLIESGGGWPSVFYLTGAVTIVWFAFWSYFVYNTPAEHPRISPEERIYIQTSLGGQSSDEVLPTPWKKMMSSKPVWAIIIAQVGHSWGFYTLLIELPTYLKTVLHFDMKQNRWLSAMPHLFMWMSSNIITCIADYCIAKKYARTVTVRKTCQSVADISSALAMIGAALISCNRTAAVAVLTIALTMSGGVCASYFPNQVEIACNHVGILMGITNTVANFAGFGTAMAAGALTNNHSSSGNWSLVFYIATGMYLVDVVVYLLLASSDEQPWNRRQDPPPGKLLDSPSSG